MASDIEIARKARLAPLEQVGAKIDLPPDAIIPYGRGKAKIDLTKVGERKGGRTGKLILVTAINPTPAGEGKTTTTVGLGDALNRIGKKAAIVLREPSLGPCFGVKGGATGGGMAQVVPMDDINLHFTGDFHAITSAHNLLSAMIDNHLNWGNTLDLDPRKITWRRVLDMNDRSLRDIVIGLGDGNGVVRQTGFDITVASEVMAILCLSSDLNDLKKRLGSIIIGERRDKSPVTARELNAEGAMTALLKDAINPNLVQTLENSPAIMHGGPFANIAHGCNSVIATRTALSLADYVVTEAGFGADLGAEKFFDIKCRKAGLSPDAVVIVATIRALKMNGGVSKKDLDRENVEAVRRGAVNLQRHIENIRLFGTPAVVGINAFTADTEAEIAAAIEAAESAGAKAILCRHWAEGSAGAEDLAHEVVSLAESGEANFKPLYSDDKSLSEKIETVATRIYRARTVVYDPAAAKSLKRFEELGFGKLPVCMAKTQYSFSDDPTKLGAPEGHTLRVREARLSAGAGFVVAICGEIMTMPGLPKTPSAERVTVRPDGEIDGLS
ncbi:MAG TPA: formate--tetrahydrofolate ligase [Parvularculaceae bacterium]|nr:formate--tetrahydrofolate ligase [Parvularculaceae bacterium]